jgi:hypothetical protein
MLTNIIFIVKIPSFPIRILPKHKQGKKGYNLKWKTNVRGLYTKKGLR